VRASVPRVEDVMSDKIYDVPSDGVKRAFITEAEYEEMYSRSLADPNGFWAEQAKRIHWTKHFSKVKNTSFDKPNVSIKWFEDGATNVAYNCIDRHLHSRGDQTAIIWEGDDPKDSRHITYRELHDEVCRFANILRTRNVKKGDRVTIYMPMIPEAAYAMLACARIGAIHSVVFGGFSPDSLAGRIEDCKSTVVITADEGLRGGRRVPLKANTDAAIAKVAKSGVAVENVIVVKRTGGAVDMDPVRDVWYHEAKEVVNADCPCEEMNAEDPLFILYTSGSTGKPKGVLHTTAGYLIFTSMTHQYVFDYHDGDVYWCTADVGWVTGHSYIVYGPLANRTTSFMYEGTPDTPARDRWWSMIEKYKISILYTAPTTIRTFMKWGEEFPGGHDLSSLRVLGSVGEPINPEAWIWYRKNIGGDRCPVVDTWWQTETGAIMITPLPGVTSTKPGAAMNAFPGISADVVDNDGKPVGNGEGGYMVITEPWPSMLRGIWGDPERYKDTYWSRFPGLYFAGDGAKKDEDGDFWLLGRIDDVMNISGHRISTTEVEHALVGHPKVAEAAVVGANDPITGQAIVAFVTVKGNVVQNEAEAAAFVQELRAHVAKEIGAIAKPRDILITPDLPKTRSGKIMRRLLRDVADHRSLGDTTTLLDPAVVSSIASQMPASATEE
jgi:acetyl-CoA synthetase